MADNSYGTQTTHSVLLTDQAGLQPVIAALRPSYGLGRGVRTEIEPKHSRLFCCENLYLRLYFSKQRLKC